MALSPDGTRIATANSWDPLARGKTDDLYTQIWDSEGKPIKRFKSHAVGSLAFSADGQWLVSGGNSDNRVLIHDRDGNPVRELAMGRGQESSPAHVAVSPDRRFLVVADHRFKPVSLRLHDSGGELVRRFNQFASGVIAMALDPTDKVIVTTSSDNQIRYWTLDGRLVKRFAAQDDYPAELAMAPNGRGFVVGGSTLTVWSGSGEKLARSPKSKGRLSVAFSPDGKRLFAGGAGGQFDVISLEKGGKSQRFKLALGDIRSMAVHPGGELVAMGGIWERFRIVDLAGKEKAAFDAPKGTLPPFSAVYALQFTPDGQHLVVATTRAGRELAVFDLSGRLVHAFATGNRNQFGSIAISSSGRLLAAGVGNRIGVWDLQTRTLQRMLSGHKGAIDALAFTRNERHLVSASSDGTVRVWNIGNGQSFAMLSDRDEWIMYTDDGYFDASRQGSDLLALVKGRRAYAVDQVALLYNRPDLIYERVGIGDRTVIDHFRIHYEERLRRSRIAAAQGAGDWSAPEVRIAEYRQDGRQLELDVELADERADLKAAQIYVNDVPLFAGLGKTVAGRKVRIKEQVTLSQGRNKVEVSAHNERGIESLRAAVFAEYKSPAPGDLYFVGMGVSQYKDPKLNLQFASQDVTALASLLRRSRGYFRQVHALELTDARANRAALEEIRAFLAQAAVDDTVIMLVSGHGAYDLGARATYYYASHETDVNDLASTAIPYDDLEAVLTGIRPRRKLLLLDACQSGEIDPAILAAIQNKAGENQLSVRASVQLARSQSARRPYLYTRDRYIYNSLDRRSGAIVFSSSLGEELSLESPALKNGVFTAALLRVLAAPQADVNKDGYVSIDELEGGVKAFVTTATRSLQHPTIDRDNIYQDFRLPVMKP